MDRTWTKVTIREDQEWKFIAWVYSPSGEDVCNIRVAGKHFCEITRRYYFSYEFEDPRWATFVKLRFGGSL